VHIVVAGAFEAGSAYAHAINTVKTAEGFAAHGHEVRVLCFRPEDGEIGPAELAERYGLRRPMEWTQVPRRVFGRKLSVHWGYATAAGVRLMRRPPDLLYARNYVLPWLGGRLGIPTVVESHAHVGNRTRELLLCVRGTRMASLKGLVTISPRLAEYYVELGAPREKLLVLPDAVDLDLFTRPKPSPESPYRTSRPVAAYAGHLYEYKGIPTILGAAALLDDVEFHLIGGWPEDVDRVRREAEALELGNVVFHGLRPLSEVPPFLWGADVLLLPPSANHPSALWTSPVKLGEYLASETPVVASRIPALEYWLRRDEVRFFTPDDADSLAAAIRWTLNDPACTREQVQRGLALARTLSYERRAGAVLAHIGAAHRQAA
jgi:glycosyltransferase involved in cell wall biosynthesis